MNIFYLDTDLEKCVKYHCDKHVVKMVLEYAQLLSTAVRHSPSNKGVGLAYKSVHFNHPSAIWARQAEDNWLELRDLALLLCKEFTYRYGKIHKTQIVIESLPKPVLPKGKTPLLLAMNSDCKGPCPIASYRKYYAKYKSHLFHWKGRQVPVWLHQEFRSLTGASNFII